MFGPEVGRADSDEIVTEVLLRSLAPPTGAHDAQVRILERLENLVDAGRIDRRPVSVWGERLCRCEACSGTGPGRAVLGRVTEFERWAAGAEPEISLRFERSRSESRIVPSAVQAIVPPRITLAVYAAGDLVGVFPCTVEGRTRSVSDGIAALEAARRLPATQTPD